MSKSTFDPTLFNFDFEFNMSSDDYKYWSTNPQPDRSSIGCYSLRYDIDDDWWTLYETVRHNSKEKEIRLYDGRIPNNEWGFQLLKNMEILLPVVQRELRIEDLTN
jgi:hypothetical protein